MRHIAFKLVSAVVLASFSFLTSAQECEATGAGISDEVFEYNSSVATDSRTNLMWARCPVGKEISGDYCTQGGAGNPNDTWENMLQAIAASTVGGYDDWRMPSVAEMRTIIDYTCATPAINATVFPLAAFYSAQYWTSTTAQLADPVTGLDQYGLAWYAVVETGEFGYYPKGISGGYYQAFMVRDVTADE